MKSATESFLGFIGIDFGTSNSGFSYLVPNERAPHTVYQYPKQRTQYPKTRTALLYRLGPDGRAERPPISWGEAAYEDMLALRPADQKCHLYVDRFKLALATDQNASSHSDKLKQSGLSPEDVIADFLKQLSEFARNHIRNRYNTWPFDKTRWAVTVPAGWSDAAKDITRRAAVSAGIIGSHDSQSLVFCYEPEAAALSCRNKGDLSLTPGDTFIVVDAGGGTIDLTWHKVLKGTDDENPVLEDASHREGITYGGTRLDEEFDKLIGTRLGDVYKMWKGNPRRTADVLDLIYNNWQRVKHGFDGSSQDAHIPVALPPSLLGSLPESLREEFDEEVGWDDKFPLKVVDLKRIFDEVVSAIMPKVEAMKSRMPPGASAPDKVLIVGGLGSNPYLIRQLRDKLRVTFGQQVEVVAPPYGYAAIVEGGALYARTPTVIVGRRAMFTYGIKVTKPAESDAPPGTVTMNAFFGRQYCNDLIDVLVVRNELLPIDHEVKRSYYCTSKKQETVNFFIVATVDDKNVKYCSKLSDSAKAQIGQLVINIKHPKKVTNPEEYRIDVSMMFGRTEVTVQAMDMQTKKLTSTTLNYTRNT